MTAGRPSATAAAAGTAARRELVQNSRLARPPSPAPVPGFGLTGLGAGNRAAGGRFPRWVGDGENQVHCRQACRLHEDGFERNQGLKFSKIIDFFDPAITDVLGHESGESRIARYHESARCNTSGDVEKFVGPIAYRRMIVRDHITRISKSDASIQLRALPGSHSPPPP